MTRKTLAYITRARGGETQWLGWLPRHSTVPPMQARVQVPRGTAEPVKANG